MLARDVAVLAYGVAVLAGCASESPSEVSGVVVIDQHMDAGGQHGNVVRQHSDVRGEHGYEVRTGRRIQPGALRRRAALGESNVTFRPSGTTTAPQ
jgi:chemotaxis response regulator CheB